MRSLAHSVSSNPKAPPGTPSSTLSVSHWRTSRARVAPSACRIAVSRRRTAARATSRPAMFAHAGVHAAAHLQEPNAPHRLFRDALAVRLGDAARYPRQLRGRLLALDIG